MQTITWNNNINICLKYVLYVLFSVVFEFYSNLVDNQGYPYI